MLATNEVSSPPTARDSSLAAQSAVLTLARIFGLAITFVIPFVLVRVFSVGDFGRYKEAVLVGETLRPLLNLGLGASLFYFLPSSRSGGQHYLNQALLVLALVGSAAAVALTTGADLIAAALDSPGLAPLLPIVGVMLFLALPGDSILSLPIIDRRPTLAAWIIAGNDILRAIVIVAAALHFRRLEAVFWAVAATAALRCLLLLAYLRTRRKASSRSINWHDSIEQLKYALPFSVAVLLQVSLEKAHQYFVAASVTTEQFAIYAVGVFNIPVAGLLVQSVCEIFLVRSARLWADRQVSDLRELWRSALEHLVVLVLPIWLSAEVFAHDIIAFVFGKAYVDAVPVFRVFLLGMLLMTVIDHGVLRSTGDTRFLVRVNLLGLAASLATLVLLTPVDMMLGAVTAYVVGIAVMRLAGLHRVGQRLELPLSATFPWSVLLKASMVGALASMLALAAVAWTADPLLRLALGGPLFLLVYMVLSVRLALVPKATLMAVAKRLLGRGD